MYGFFPEKLYENQLQLRVFNMAGDGGDLVGLVAPDGGMTGIGFQILVYLVGVNIAAVVTCCRIS